MRLLYIILLLLLLFYWYIKYENFTCNRDLYYSSKIFRPYRMTFMYPKSKIIKYDTNLLITKSNINKLLSYIDINKDKPDFKEVSGSVYDYEHGFRGYKYDINYLNKIKNKLFLLMKTKFIKTDMLFPKYCNNFTKCNLRLIDYRVISINKYRNEIAINGQLLLKFNVSSYIFLIKFLASYTDKLNVYEINCEGIEIYNKYFNDDSLNYVPFTKIFGSILYGKNDIQNTYLYSSTEINNEKLPIKKKKSKYNYKCYGKQAVNKSNCENIYDLLGNKLERVGIWDKPCESDKECFFYNKNKNYQNNFGGCKNGTCQLPIGAIRISPRKFIDNNSIFCHNCLDNTTNCCQEQLDKKLYPNLLSPDYAFKDDNYVRNNIK